MKKIKRVIVLGLAMLMILSCFAGCGSKNASTDKGSNSTQKPTPAPSLTPNGGGGATMLDQATDSNGEPSAYPSFFSLTPDQVAPSSDAVLKVTTQAEPASLNPLISGQGMAMYSTIFMYDLLLQYNPDTNELMPWLATSYEWIDDTTLELKIREGVTSQLGDPYTAHDTVFSLQWGYDCAALATYVSSVIDIENTKAIDDYTVQIALKNPSPFFIYELARIAYVQVVEKSVEKVGGRDSDAAKDTSVYATGPYKVTGWSKGTGYQTERNENWWYDVDPYYANIDVYFITDPNARYMGIEAGDFEFDGESTISLILDALKSDTDDITGYLRASYSMMNFVFNSEVEKFQNKALRQAISMAVNYDAINEVVFGGWGVPATSIIPSSVSWYDGPADGAEHYYKYDVEAAKAKLVEAGYPDGFEFNLYYHGGNASVIKAAEVLQNNLKTANITCNCKPLEAAAFNQQIKGDDWEAYLTANPGYVPNRSLYKVDPAMNNADATGSCGKHWYDGEGGNDYIHDLIHECLYTPNLADSEEAYQEIQDIVREYVPFLTITEMVSGGLCNPDIVSVGLYFGGNPCYFATYPAEYLQK